MHEASESLNYLAGVAAPKYELGFSAAQSEGLRHLREVVGSVGSPPCSAVEAHWGLCGASPGYDESVLRAAYQRERVSLPSPGMRCKPAPVLKGDALGQWVHWQQRILRQGPADAEDIRPCSDQSLVRDRVAHAHFVADLCRLGPVALGKKRPRAAGIVFVWKSDKERLRMILDTRKAHSCFEGPRTRAGHRFCLELYQRRGHG